MKRYRPRLAASDAKWNGGNSEGRYVVHDHAGHMIARGETFSRETADLLCEALEGAFNAGAESRVEA